MDMTLRLMEQIEERHPALTISRQRWLRFNEELNGFKGCFLKCGRRVMVWEERLLDTIRRQNGLPGVEGEERD